MDSDGAVTTGAPAAYRTLTAGQPRGHRTTATVRVTCAGAATQPCDAKLTMRVTERLRRGQPVGEQLPRVRTVTVGSTSLHMSGGARRTVTIALNQTGRRLLADFRRAAPRSRRDSHHHRTRVAHPADQTDRRVQHLTKTQGRAGPSASAQTSRTTCAAGIGPRCRAEPSTPASAWSRARRSTCGSLRGAPTTVNSSPRSSSPGRAERFRVLTRSRGGFLDVPR